MPADRARDWLYYRLDAPDLAGVQHLVQGLLPDLVDTARSLDAAHRWFFLRYSDGGGPHLRVRFHADLDTLAAVGPALEAVLADAGARLPLVDRRIALYEPELHTYGGPTGVCHAEGLFTGSSEFVLGLLGPAFWRRRAGYALLALLGTVGSLSPGRRLPFLSEYADYWAAGTRPVLARSAAGRIGQQAVDQVDGLLDDPPTVRLVRRYAADAVRRLADPDWSHPDIEDRLFYSVHLTNNRLAVRLQEEAFLAELVLARPDWAWSVAARLAPAATPDATVKELP